MSPQQADHRRLLSAANRILDRLSGTKQTGTGRWIARCPAHEDRYPSLSIRETDDGRVLIYCFAGCEVGAIVSAIGLELAHLFPDEKSRAHLLPPIRGGFSARELLELNSHEAEVVAIIAQDAQRRPLTVAEVERLAQAATRLSRASGVIHGR